MERINVSTGITWVSIPEVNFHLLCGCPMDSVKHLMRLGLIHKTNKNKRVLETGPNAILLSDTQMQNGDFANVSEFPVLHMLYRQGMKLPEKPMLLGTEEQLAAQSRYILLGSFGITDLKDLEETGFTRAEAESFLRMKQRFNSNQITKAEDLLDLRKIGDEPERLENGVIFFRKSFNTYEISYEGETVTVDLNLSKSERYEPPYRLDFHRIKRDLFSVIHIGEGNGWDRNRPCMGSIITYKGKFYLIDAGPSLEYSLSALGISVNDIEGIFQTHAHDDHFCGLTSLVHTDHKIKYFATPLVRKSVEKKLSALMGVDEEMFVRSFEIQDLENGVWNSVDGLEILPVISPHPVETTILYFRTEDNGHKASYGHLADIASDRILKNFLTPDSAGNRITKQFYNNIWHSYLMPVDLKKVDVGGGMIHGEAVDFGNDHSRRVILSHKENELNNREKETGSNASFGLQDQLIQGDFDYSKIDAGKILESLLTGIDSRDLETLLDSPILHANPGTILIKKGGNVEQVFVLVNGLIEMINPEDSRNCFYSSGSLIGDISVLRNIPAEKTFRSASYIDYLVIPKDMFMNVLKKNKKMDFFTNLRKKTMFIRNSGILGKTCSCKSIFPLAQAMESLELKKGSNTEKVKERGIVLLQSGKINLEIEGSYIEQIGIGRVFGIEKLFPSMKSAVSEKVENKSVVYIIPFEMLSGIPIVLWKLMKVHRHRLRIWKEKNNQ